MGDPPALGGAPVGGPQLHVGVVGQRARLHVEHHRGGRGRRHPVLPVGEQGRALGGRLVQGGARVGRGAPRASAIPRISRQHAKTIVQFVLIARLPPLMIKRLRLVENRDIGDNVIAQRRNKLGVAHTVVQPTSGPVVAFLVYAIPIVAVGNAANEFAPPAEAKKIGQTPAQSFHAIGSFRYIDSPRQQIILGGFVIIAVRPCILKGRKLCCVRFVGRVPSIVQR